MVSFEGAHSYPSIATGIKHRLRMVDAGAYLKEKKIKFRGFIQNSASIQDTVIHQIAGAHFESS